jgi:hypothetical protein
MCRIHLQLQKDVANLTQRVFTWASAWAAPIGVNSPRATVGYEYDTDYSEGAYAG